MTDENRSDEEVQEVQGRYASRLKERLAKSEITVEDARDGIMDCFVSTYYEGVAQGLEGMLDIRGSDEQVADVTRSLFRKKLRSHGGSFLNPTVEALSAVKEEVDDEFRFGDLPAELKGLHDQVCTLLLSKARGDLPHQGDRSVVGDAEAGASPAEPSPAEPSPAEPSPAEPSPEEPSPEEPSPSASGGGERFPAEQPSQPRSVTGGLRDALLAYIHELAAAVHAGESADKLAQRLERARTLVDTLANFER